MEQKEFSVEAEDHLVPSPADEDDDSDLRLAGIEGKNEKAVVPLEQKESSAETEDSEVPSPADNDIDSDRDATSESDEDSDGSSTSDSDDGNRIPAWRTRQPIHMSAK